jgi:hypothetical protein
MQETLEQAAGRAVRSGLFKDETLFIAGAKWQAQTMYSEEEVFKMIGDFRYDLDIDEVSGIKEWFEQNKKA